MAFVAAFLLAVVATGGLNIAAQTVTLSNVIPRRSADNAIMDAHDSKMLLKDGVYYWYAASYGNCTEPQGNSGCSVAGAGNCGFQANHNVSLFTSTDLLHWSDPVVVFTATQLNVSGAIMYAPKVVYNAQTGKFVLWFNWLTWGGSWNNSYYAVATSATASGTFEIQTQIVETLAFRDVGDLNLFVDDDGAGYVLYTGHISSSFFNPTHVMSIERLAPDFLTSLGSSASSGAIGVPNVEAPMIFRNAQDGLYHAVFGQTCCYCSEGTSALTDYTSTTPLGPYTARGVVGSAVPAQSTDIFAYVTGQGETAYMYIGDRWQSSPDTLKAHDFTAWCPIAFNADGSMAPLNYSASFTVSVGQ